MNISLCSLSFSLFTSDVHARSSIQTSLSLLVLLLLYFYLLFVLVSECSRVFLLSVSVSGRLP